MLHGIDTIKKEAKQPLQNSQTNIVCVIGTVPTFLLAEGNKTLNTPVPVRSYQDVSKYAGNNLPNFTMYDALETVLTESGGATIYMINVYDDAKHRTEIENEQHVPQAAKFNIEHIGVSDLVLRNGDTIGEEGVDYSVMLNTTDTTVTLLSDTFKAFSSVECSYTYADVSKILASDIIGEISSNGSRSGIKAISTITQLYGDNVNIIIAPKYSAEKAIRDELVVMAEDLKARVYLDAPKGISVNNAVSARLSAIGGYDLTCSSKNAYMAVPYVYRYNNFTGENMLQPLSPVLAGLRVKLNKNMNVAKSIDNTASVTIKGLEYPVEFILNKENTESNALNAVGLGTVINWKGTYRIWGARNCAYPSENGIETFDSVIDTANFIEKTIEDGSFRCVGSKITRAFIDDVLENIKAKFNSWKNPETSLILDGDVWFDEELNTAESISDGTIIFSYDFCPPSVAEHIRYNSYINIKYITTALSNN